MAGDLRSHTDPFLVSPLEGDVEEEGDLVANGEIELEVEEEVSGEGRAPITLRDPGAPIQEDVDQRNITHVPYRAWCPACVSGRARDRDHHKKEGQDEKRVPELVFDYAFLGAEGERDTVTVSVFRDRRTHKLFAHVVPRKVLAHEHGAEELIKDITTLAYQELILKCDGEPALKNLQDEVEQRA